MISSSKDICLNEHVGVLYLTSVSAVQFGGVETLTIRMAKWCVGHSIDTFWIGMKNPIDARFVEGMQKLDLKESKCLDYNPNKTVIDCVDYIDFQFEQYDRIVILCIGGIDTVVASEKIKHKYKNVNFDVHFYVVGPYSLCCEPTPFFARFTGKIRKNKWLVNTILDRNMVVFMDQQCLNLTRERKGLKLKKEIDIKRLPMFIEEFSSELIQKRYNENERFIITCTRLDFPFKEYVIGLIDVYKRIIVKYPDVKLLIIGGGSGLEKLNVKIGEMPEEIRNNIQIVPPIPYEELNEMLKNGYVYVGMGTTLLDACGCSLPCLMAYPYNDKCETNGFFCDNWDNVGEVGRGEEMSQYLLKLFGMDFNDYYSCSKACYDAYKEHYNIDTIMKEWLIKRNTDNSIFISNIAINIYNFLIKSISLIRRIYEKRK